MCNGVSFQSLSLSHFPPHTLTNNHVSVCVSDTHVYSLAAPLERFDMRELAHEHVCVSDTHVYTLAYHKSLSAMPCLDTRVCTCVCVVRIDIHV